MIDEKSFFSEFNPTSKQEWLEKVKKDLKGKALETLDFEVEEGLVLSPFFNEGDVESYQNSGLQNFRSGDWNIGACFDVFETKSINEQLKQALEGGVNAPLLVLKQELSTRDITDLYEGIEPAWIHNNFEGEDSILHSFFDKWSTYLKGRGCDLEQVYGNLGLQGFSNDFNSVWEEMPNFSTYKIIEKEQADYSSGLASLLIKAHELLEQSKHPEEMVTQIQFKIWADKNYFASISKLRAFHILWANFLKAYNCPIDIAPNIQVHFAPSILLEDYTEGGYQNMINAATIALSAVIGGGTTIFVPPASVPETPLIRRMARNVNHLLKMESYIDKVIDPAAGSYYIESLTKELAERAWRKFQAG